MLLTASHTETERSLFRATGLLPLKTVAPASFQAQPVLSELLKRFPASAHLWKSHCSPGRKSLYACSSFK